MADKKLLVALATALGVALMVIAFLLGRQTAPPPPAPEITVHTPPVEVRLPPAPPAPPPELPPAPQADVVLEEKDGQLNLITPPPAPATLPIPRATTSAPPTGPDPVSAAIAGYLAAVDQIRVGPGGDQQGFANQLMAEAASGDTSGLDQLVKDSKVALDKLKAITPPPQAADHHKGMVALMVEANQVLATMSDGLRRQDPKLLEGLLTTGQAMQAKAKEVERLEADLRARAGP